MGTGPTFLEIGDESVCDSVSGSAHDKRVECPDTARVDAAVRMDAQNAPTRTWKTAQDAVSHSAHMHHRWMEGKTKNDVSALTRFTHKIPDRSVSFPYILISLHPPLPHFLTS